MAERTGESCVGGVAAHRLQHQAPERFAPDTGPERVAGLRLGFHELDEIGPRMLARIAKHTGLRPEDL
jgi:hypothetical protein